MKEISQEALKGEQFLLDNQDRYRLEIEYNNDMDNVFIQLVDIRSNECVVFDGSDLFTQIYEYFNKKPKDDKLKLDEHGIQSTTADVLPKTPVQIDPMQAAKLIFEAAHMKDTQLALALDKVAKHYIGQSMLALAGIYEEVKLCNF